MRHLVQQHVATWTHVRNTDDFKEYKYGNAAVDTSYSPDCCAYFPQNSIMSVTDYRAIEITELGVQTSCAETLLSLACCQRLLD
jgi:hypothetical protein